MSAEPVGNYGVRCWSNFNFILQNMQCNCHFLLLEACIVGCFRIIFDDLHKTGIYSWDYFYHLGSDKYSLMRNYIKTLRKYGLSRDPPRRKWSTTHPYPTRWRRFDVVEGYAWRKLLVFVALDHCNLNAFCVLHIMLDQVDWFKGVFTGDGFLISNCLISHDRIEWERSFWTENGMPIASVRWWDADSSMRL